MTIIYELMERASTSERDKATARAMSARPQMFFEQVEYVRVTADEAEAAEAAKGEPPDTDGESDGDADKDE